MADVSYQTIVDAFGDDSDAWRALEIVADGLAFDMSGADGTYEGDGATVKIKNGRVRLDGAVVPIPVVEKALDARRHRAAPRTRADAIANAREVFIPFKERD